MKQILFIASLFLFSFNVFAQNTSVKMSRQQALADIDSLMSYISEVHPNMYFQRSEKAFQKDLKRIRQQLPDSIDKVELFKCLCPLVNSLGDGHTVLHMPQEVLLLNGGKLIPLMVEPRDNGDLMTMVDMFGLPKGVKILSVNGIKTKQLWVTVC